MQSRPSDQMNFRAKRSCFSINDPQINCKHCKGNNNPQIKSQTLQINFAQIHNFINYGASKKKKGWERCPDGNRRQATTTGFLLTLCIVTHTVFKTWITKVTFSLSQMSFVMRFVSYSNWFPIFYLIRTDFRTCKQDFKRMIDNTLKRWQLWSLEMSNFTVFGPQLWDQSFVLG